MKCLFGDLTYQSCDLTDTIPIIHSTVCLCQDPTQKLISFLEKNSRQFVDVYLLEDISLVRPGRTYWVAQWLNNFEQQAQLPTLEN